jgi:hypothetical protein
MKWFFTVVYEDFYAGKMGRKSRPKLFDGSFLGVAGLAATPM